MDRERLEEMVLQAKNEINQIERRMTELTARRDLLWRFVASSHDLIQNEAGKPASGDLASASSVVNSSPRLANALLAPNSSSVALPSARVWEGVQLVMGLAKRPLNVREIVELLDKHKIIVGGDHPRENVRSAITRKDDVFEKIDRGFYVLREWPERIKQMRKDEPISTDVA